MKGDEHPLVEAMKRPKLMPDAFTVDLPDAQIGDEVKFVVKAVQGGKAVLEAQRCDEKSEPPMVMTQESSSPS